jgi:hypothetical protein
MTLAEILTGLRLLPDLDAEVKLVIFQTIALGLREPKPRPGLRTPPWDWARDT